MTVATDTAISVVIPNWNGAHFLRGILSDLNRQTVEPRECIVVDNGSTDDSRDVAESHGARVISLGVNRGFAPAVNQGVAEAASEFVAILNNDLELPPSWLERIAAAFAEDPECAFAVGKLLSAKSREVIDGTWDAVSRAACAWRCGQGLRDSDFWNRPRVIQFAPFTAVMVRKSLFGRLGGLDGALESYLEDVEFGLRCASNRYIGRYVPGAFAYHVGSGTTGPWSPISVRKISRNQLLILARHYPLRLLFRFGWPIAVGQGLWGLVALRHGAGLPWLLGKIEGLRMFPSSRRRGGETIESILGSSEREIYELQRQAGFDWYWWLYFTLT
jgi:GT2 family glycosyltransferase